MNRNTSGENCNGIEGLVYFYHPDHLGSSSYITDANGEVSQHLEYFAFGETFVEEHSNKDRTPYLYNAKELDEETGLYYYGARYYSPEVSIWLSVDPLALKYPNRSPYEFTASNPIKYVDPDGREIVIPTTLKGRHRRKIMKNLRKLTNDKLRYNKGTGRVTISKSRSGNKTKGTALIKKLISDSKTTTIRMERGEGNEAIPTDWDGHIGASGSGVDVNLDPESKNDDFLTRDTKTGKTSRTKRPIHIGLGHELIHADHINDGGVNPNQTNHTYTDEDGDKATSSSRSEEYRTVGVKDVRTGDITENDLRKETKSTRNKMRVTYE